MTSPEPTAAVPRSDEAVLGPIDDGGVPAIAVTVAPGPPRNKFTAVFISFRSRDFRYLALSTLALGFGQWAQQIGLAWLMLVLTNSATQLGAISAFRGGIGIISAPLGGPLADRYPRRLILIWTTAASMVQAVLLSGLILSGHIAVWHVYVLALLGGVIQSISQPARQAFVYDVSTPETLQNAVAMNSMVQNISRVTGPPIAGALIGFYGTSAPFLLLAGTQVLAMALTVLIRNNPRPHVVRAGNAFLSFFREIGEGFRAVGADRSILGLIIVATIPSLLVYPYLPFLALVSRDLLHHGSQGYGWLASMAGYGSIAGLLLLAFMQNPKHKGWLLLATSIGYTLSVFAFSQSHSYFLSLACLGIAGLFISPMNALNNTLLQLTVRDDVRGRVMSIWQLGTAFQPLGALPMGLLVARYGVQVGIGSFMLLATLAFAVFTLCWASVRRL